MPDLPYPLISPDVEEWRNQILDMFRDIYEQRIGGASVGDVFEISGETLQLKLKSGCGLQKTNGELDIDVDTIGSSGAILKATYTAKGDIITGKAAGEIEVKHVGADNSVFKASSGSDGGVTWANVTAAEVTNTPAGAIAATTVQAAINELDTEKVPTTRTITATTPITIAGTTSADLSADRTIAISATPSFTSVTVGNTGLIVGTSTPFSDSSGTLTLQNIDAIDATTEATLEGALDIAGDVTSTGMASTVCSAITILGKADGNLLKGQCVYISGNTGNNPKFALADNTDATKCRAVGLVVANATTGNDVYVRRWGLLLNVNCAAGGDVNADGGAWSAGDLVFLTASGKMTKVRPTSGRSVKAAYVTEDAGVQNLLVYPLENPVWHTCASGEDNVLRLGDNGGTNKVSIRDYANSEVASVDSDGNAIFPKVSADHIAEKTGAHGIVLDNDLTRVGKISVDHIAEATGSHKIVFDNALSLSTDLAVADGGTGASTLTDHGVLVGSGTDAVTALTVGTNGQVLVGSTGADPVFATITDGEGIDTTLGAGALTIACETTSTTNPGVIELATQAEVLAGTDTSRAVVPVDLWAKTAIDVNPKAFAQGVAMTYAASGSTGIQVADNDNIDFGTGNYTIVRRVSVPDYTPSADVVLIQKTDATNGWLLQIDTTGVLQLLRNAEAAKSSTSAPSVTDGTEHEIACVVTTETASVAGSVVFYVDGVILGTSVAITAGAPTTVNNAVSLYVAGTSAARSASTNKSAILYNRALSAAEVLSLYQNGIAETDKWGSQTALSSWTDNFTGWSVDGGVTNTGGALTWNVAVAGEHRAFLQLGAGVIMGRYWRVRYEVISNDLVGGSTFYLYGDTTNKINGTNVTLSTSVGVHEVDVGGNTGSCNFIMFYMTGEIISGAMVVDNVYLTPLGATLALEPEGVQPNPGQWLDSSTNKLHAMQPATGSSLTRKKDTFEVRWTNTWAGTQEAQYIGGVNQAVLPSGCYITDIIGVVTGTTVEDIIIGDGSDTDRWVTITTGLAAGTTAFTLANRISDGTNYKLVVDPDANFTGSIAFTVRGIILQ